MEIVERPDVDKRDTLVSLTPNAAEKIRELMAEDPEGETSVLRVAIQGGGCSGFQYGLGFDAGPVDDDETLELHGVTIVIDPYSAPYLKGATIDFLNGLEESGFKIDNPNASGVVRLRPLVHRRRGRRRRSRTRRARSAAAAPAARTDLAAQDAHPPKADDRRAKTLKRLAVPKPLTRSPASAALAAGNWIAGAFGIPSG